STRSSRPTSSWASRTPSRCSPSSWRPDRPVLGSRFTRGPRRRGPRLFLQPYDVDCRSGRQLGARVPNRHTGEAGMNGRISAWIGVCAAALALTGVASAQESKPKVGEPAKAPAPKETPKHEYSVEGQYVESYTCRIPCPCEMTGPMSGCKGVGAYEITK